VRRRACGDQRVSPGRATGLTDFPRCGNNDPVIRGHRSFRLPGVVLLAAVVGLAPGCTLFGDKFLPEQPLAEVTVQGTINVDRASGQEAGCSAGGALFWGIARNTGDVDVDDVFIEIDALDANKGVLGTYRVNVFNGTITDVTGATSEETVKIAGTSLAVDESGTFSVCTGLPVGSVAGTAYRTDFIVIDVLK